MSHYEQILVRLHGDEDWEAWGDDWEQHIDKIGQLASVPDRMCPPPWLLERPFIGLDYMATLHEVSLAEVRCLFATPAHFSTAPYYAKVPDAPDPWKQRREQDEALIAGLPEDGRYAVVWLEW